MIQCTSRCSYLLLLAASLSVALPSPVIPAESAGSSSPVMSPFVFTEARGPYSVGLKVIEQYDHSRTYRAVTNERGEAFHGERARPVQTLVWYPSERSPSKVMTVEDYMALWLTETSFGDSRPSLVARQWRSALGRTLNQSLWSVRDAPAVRARFPVVIYAPSLSKSSWENADLCEYLSSQGYVVIAGPSLGPHTLEMPLDLTGINAQAQDISFLIGFARTLPDTDLSSVAVMGFSWGGISNLFAAARDSRIGALIDLDGSVRYYPGLVKQAGDVHPESMTLPLLAFLARNFSLEDEDHFVAKADRDGPSVLNAWTHGDLWTVHMLGMAHAEFSSMHQRNDDLWWEFDNVWPMMQGDFTREDAMRGFGWVAQYCLQFLNAYLKHDAAALAFLTKTPAQNGVPAHVMEMTYRPRTGAPLSFDSFRSEIGRKGFDHIDEVYADFKRQSSDFELSSLEVNDWAESLLGDGNVPACILVLKLIVELYPNSADSYVRLAGAYALSGNKQRAVENYHLALRKDPSNGESRRMLYLMSVGK